MYAPSETLGNRPSLLIFCLLSLPFPIHPQSNPSDRNRGGHSTHAVDNRDMSGPGWLFPDQEGWVAYDEAVHGELDEEIKELTEGLDPIWVRIVDPKTGEPKLESS